MKKILLHLSCLLMAGYLGAQPPSFQIPEFAEYVSSRDGLDRMPAGFKYSYGLVALQAIAGRHPELSVSDLEVLDKAASGVVPLDRYFAALRNDCQTYRLRSERGQGLADDFFISAIARNDQLEHDTRDGYHEGLFAQLSPIAQQMVLQKIEAARGKRVFSRMRTNWTLYAARYPNVSRILFVKSCETLEERLARHEHWAAGIEKATVCDDGAGFASNICGGEYQQ